MNRIRSYVIAALAMMAGSAFAQFDSPAPLAWRWQQSSSISPNGSPLVDGNVIYFNLGSRVYAIDRETGNTKWKFPNVEALTGSVRRSPVLIEGVLCVATDDKKVFGIDPTSGAIKWVYETPFPIVSQIVGVGKNIAISMEGSTIMAVEVAEGKPIYDEPFKFLEGLAGPIYANGRDAIIFFDTKSTLRSLGLASKSTQWKQTFSTRPADGTLTVANGSIYLYSGAFITSLNAISGSPKWQQSLPETMLFSPEVGNGTVATVSRDGNVYVYDERGTLLTKKPIELKSQPIAKATSVGKMFVVATANGAVSLVDATNPDLQWQYYVRPMNEAASKPSTTTGAGAGPGGGRGGPGGGGGIGGGGGLGGGGGQGGPGGAQNAPPTTIVTIQAAASPVLAGKTLLIPAQDGSILAFDKESGVDLTAPTVKPVWPPQGEIVSGLNGQEFIFRIDDDASGVAPKTITFDIDGKPYKFEFGREGFLISRISTTDKNPALSAGRHSLNVTVKDWLGNETKISFTIRIDNTLKVIPRGKTDSNGNGLPGGGGPGRGGPGGGGGIGGGGGGLGSPGL